LEKAIKRKYPEIERPIFRELKQATPLRRVSEKSGDAYSDDIGGNEQGEN
jgi:hypothetical protein